jgi:BolA protein
MNTADRIRDKLAVLSPTFIAVEDEGDQHIGHVGAKNGGHYHLTVVSEKFSGQNSITRHRTVYSILSELLQREIHALRIEALTPNEYQNSSNH